MIMIQLQQNKIILTFETEQDAKLFYNFLKSFKEIKTISETTQTNIKLDPEEKRKYILFITHKNKPVTDKETIKAYLSALQKFIKCSDGLITPRTLLECVKNKHYERALRNYLHMKYYYKEINKTTYLELLERIPKKDNKYIIAQDKVPVSKILIDIAEARKRTRYYSIYLALLYSGGIRLKQLMNSLNNQYKDVGNEIIKIKLSYKGTKTALYAYLPKTIYNQIKTIKTKTKTIVKTFNELKLTQISLIRSFCWQTGKQLLGETLMLLLQGRLGELRKRITVTSYDDLIFQLDKRYFTWKKFVDELAKYSTTDRNKAKLNAKKIVDKYELLMPV